MAGEQRLGGSRDLAGDDFVSRVLSQDLLGIDHAQPFWDRVFPP